MFSNTISADLITLLYYLFPVQYPCVFSGFAEFAFVGFTLVLFGRL